MPLDIVSHSECQPWKVPWKVLKPEIDTSSTLCKNPKQKSAEFQH